MRRKKIVLDPSQQPSPGLQISFCVDWLAFTMKNKAGVNIYNFTDAFDAVSPKKECKPMHGYNRGVRWQFGAMMLWHTDKPEMGAHFIIGGAALKALYAEGLDAVFLIQRAAVSYAKFTMIHLAMDIMNGSFDPVQMNGLMEAKQYNGRAQAGSLITNLFGGKTCYVGSWNSDRFYRFYDKAAEQSIENLNWKRVELVLKSDYAQEFGYKFSNGETIDKAIEVFRGTVKAMADFNQADWLAAFEGKIDKLSVNRPKERKTREWLLTQVAPALARYVYETGDDEVLVAFSNEVDGIYQKIANGL